MSTLEVPMVLDSVHDGRLIRRLFMLEAAGNILGAIPMLLLPSSVVSLLTGSSIRNPSDEALVQWLGALTLGLTPQLLLARANTRRALAIRPLVYLTLGAGEVFLVATFLGQLVMGKEGVSRGALWGAVAMLGMPLLGRGYVLWVKPELFGRVKGEKTN